MDFATRLEALRQVLPDVVAIEEVPSVDQPAIVVPAEAIERVARQLREHPSLQFQVLAELTAADYWPLREPRFEVVYLFVSMGPEALGSWRTAGAATSRQGARRRRDAQGAEASSASTRTPTGTSARCSTCSAWPSRAIPTCGAS